jgi:hypothetical protein
MIMKRTKRLLDRFPSFYNTWDGNSLIFKVLSAFGKRLDEAEKELIAVLRSHWIDTAFGSDLDKLGSIFNIKRKSDESDGEYRERLKRAVMEFKGGGTINAVLSTVRAELGLPRNYPLEIIENPPEKKYREFEVRTGETFKLGSESVLDATPSITISVKTEGAKVTNPMLINLDTEEMISFNGIIHSGERLRIEAGKAFLNDRDVTAMLSTPAMPRLYRKGSTWKYAEPLEKEIGVFDAAKFDYSVFAIGIPTVIIAFEWIAYQPATFEIRIPRDALSKKDVSLMQEVVDSIKAAGVKALIKIV